MAADTDNIHEDIRSLREMMTENLRITTKLETVLFPGGDGVNAIQSLSKRVAKLENWRSFLTGAWAVVTTGFGLHIYSKH